MQFQIINLVKLLLKLFFLASNQDGSRYLSPLDPSNNERKNSTGRRLSLVLPKPDIVDSCEQIKASEQLLSPEDMSS